MFDPVKPLRRRWRELEDDADRRQHFKRAKTEVNPHHSTQVDQLIKRQRTPEVEVIQPFGLADTSDCQVQFRDFGDPAGSVPAGPWLGIEGSFEGHNNNGKLTASSQLLGFPSGVWAELDRLKECGQKFLRRSHLLTFDGSCDLPDTEHPNLTNFSFSFSPTEEPSSLKHREPKQTHSVASESDGDKSRRVLERAQLAKYPRFCSGDSVSPNSPGLSSPPRKELNLVHPSLLSHSPETRSLKRPQPRSTLQGPTPPHTPSPVYNKNSKPRSLQRVIRSDESWQVQRKTPRTASKVEQRQEPPRTHARREPPRFNSVTFRNSSGFLEAVQPLQPYQNPTPKELLAQEYSDEELKPEPLSIHKRKSWSADESEAPRLTRQHILRHLASDGNLYDSSEQVVKRRQITDSELIRRIKKSRRAGVIFDIIESDSGDEARLQKKLQAEIATMADLLHPVSAVAMTEHRREAIRLAKTQETSVIEKCKRSNQEMPAYAFDELIGKGSYGRVYKGRQTDINKVVAIKVIDIDEADFRAAFEQKDEQIKDFNREIRILKQAQDSGAPNMNLMIEALPVHSQLWLICEYCPGGSVKTLMRATNDRLAEQYIIIVARELARALVSLHDAGIMHRDIKAANVLIHEEGRLQLCDFGVATILDTKSDKRKTFIGTPHWMPPELFVENPEYSDEVDVWEYGCTLYECALGKPPHSDLRERQQLASRMRRLKQSISLPEHEEFSDGLRDLVAYTLSPDAKARPSMKEVLNHKHLLNTSDQYPTASLSQLVKVYYAWLYSGGQRASLFMPGGAVVTDGPGSISTPIDEWNFSTTEVFEKRLSATMDSPDLAQMSPSYNEGDATPRAPTDAGIASPSVKEMTHIEKANFEARVQRGEGLANLFDRAKPDYEYKTRTDFRPLIEERRVSDLPFRAMAEDRPSSIASNVIDLGDFDSEDYAIAAPMKEETTIQLADAATIRAKRSDSKGPTRDTSATRKDSLTKANTSTIDQKDPRVSAHDFAFPPIEWALADESGVRDTQEGTMNELTPMKDDGRKTMDWTFASAFQSSAEDNDEAEAAASQQNKAKKHATLQWSFSNAMAEADTGSDDDAMLSASRRTTPKRPAALLRTMTQPVTSSEVHTAEDFPRPSTAMSEAYSESSMSSADFDPFALEGNQELPNSMAQAMDNMGVGSYYRNDGGFDDENMMAYPSIVAGPAPYMLGAPARISEPGFPEPQIGSMPSSLAQNGKARVKQHSSGSSSSGRPRIDMMEAVPPSQEALTLDAPVEMVESELSRLLGGLQASLASASQALQMIKRPKKKGSKITRGRTRPSSSEWEDEE